MGCVETAGGGVVESGIELAFAVLTRPQYRLPGGRAAFAPRDGAESLAEKRRGPSSLRQGDQGTWPSRSKRARRR